MIKNVLDETMTIYEMGKYVCVVDDKKLTRPYIDWLKRNRRGEFKPLRKSQFLDYGKDDVVEDLDVFITELAQARNMLVRLTNGRD